MEFKAVVLLIVAAIAFRYCYAYRRDSRELIGKRQVEMQQHSLYACLVGLALTVAALVVDPFLSFVVIVCALMLAAIAANLLKHHRRGSNPDEPTPEEIDFLDRHSLDPK